MLPIAGFEVGLEFLNPNMSMMSEQVFTQLETLAAESGVEAALDYLADHFRESGDFFQLFEALKMKVRHQAGLPILYAAQPDDMPEATQRALEDGLLEACREVGTGLVQSGKLREGWMYIQPLADRELSKKLVREFPVADDVLDDLIDITIAGGADPEYGYGLLLERYGTCNAITAYDTQVSQLDIGTQRQLAVLLVQHLYSELTGNVRRHLKQAAEEKGESDPTAELTDMGLSELIADRRWVFANGGHHIDTTHLASTVRIGRIVDDQASLQMLLELTEYGNQLSPDFHYAGSAPFEKTYPDHLQYYSGLLDKNLERATRHLEQKAKSAASDHDRYMAYHVLVDFLSRTGQSQQAIKVATEQLLGTPDEDSFQQPMAVPEVFGLAKNEADFDQLREFYRQRDDALGFTIGLLKP